MKFFKDETSFKFVEMRFIAFVLSALLIAGSIGLLATKGLNFGIDFTGGTVIEIRVETTPDLAHVRENLAALDLGAIQIQEFGQPNDLLIRLPEQGEEGTQKQAVENVQATLDEMFGAVDYRRTEFVGPQVGQELQRKGLYAVGFALLGILLYIWVRFEWPFALAAVGALTHDSLLIMGLFSLAGMEFSLSSVAAILMIAGYSINDTVVVFDRVREELRKYKKMPMPQVLNLALNKTLSRTLMTSLTTLLALIALFVFGGEVIRSFVDALIAGIVIGTYSSIFIAVPLLLTLKADRRGQQPAAEESNGQG